MAINKNHSIQASRLPVMVLMAAGLAACVPSTNDIYAQVLKDSIAQYEMAARSGSAVDRCVQAGIVVAAALQAKKQADYDKWLVVRKQECARAGVPM